MEAWSAKLSTSRQTEGAVLFKAESYRPYGSPWAIVGELSKFDGRFSPGVHRTPDNRSPPRSTHPLPLPPLHSPCRRVRQVPGPAWELCGVRTQLAPATPRATSRATPRQLARPWFRGTARQLQLLLLTWRPPAQRGCCRQRGAPTRARWARPPPRHPLPRATPNGEGPAPGSRAAVWRPRLRPQRCTRGGSLPRAAAAAAACGRVRARAGATAWRPAWLASGATLHCSCRWGGRV